MSPEATLKRKPVDSITEDGGELLPPKKAKTNEAPSQPVPVLPKALSVLSSSPSQSQTTGDKPAAYQRNRPDKKKRWLYLGVSSTASFNVQVAALLQSAFSRDGNDEQVMFTLDGDAYKISWNRTGSNDLPDLSDLPSIDYAIYLTNTVKFHLDSLFRLFDGEDFMQHLHEFYADASAKVKSDRLWFTQFLLIMALGKGLLNAKKAPGTLAGSDFFCRAMSILPETAALHEEPVLASEVLCLVALYFYCLDMRQTAYSYIGQALRIALVEGNHTYLQDSQLEEKLAQRCTNVWWTVYILDRGLSSIVGVPPSVNDRHIRTSLPQVTHSSQKAATLGLHIKLSRIVSDILSELYSVDGSLESSYLAKTRSVLRDLAQIAEEIEETIDFKFKDSLDTVSKAATHLRLMYHQCIILATRPLLLCLLQEKLKSLTTRNDNQLHILPAVQDLVQTCVDSAVKTLKMLSALSKNNMLNSFLPFDLDFTCSAASILILSSSILRYVSLEATMQRLASKILEEMILAGNNAASLRQKELQQLGRLGQRLWDSQPQAGGRTSDSHPDENPHVDVPNDRQVLMYSEALQTEDQRATATATTFLPNHVDETLTPLSFTTSQDLVNNFDLDYEHMLLMANQLDVDAFSSSIDFDEFGRLDWLELGI